MTICLFWDKHLQTDTKQRPRLSGWVTQHLFRVVGFAPPQENTERSGAGPSITAEQELGSPDRSGLNTVAIQYPPVMISVVLLKTQTHM